MSNHIQVSAVVDIPINMITPDPDQPRKTLNWLKIGDMAKGMRNSGEGVINPIEIDTQYMIITGEQRWQAACKADLKTVPCKIISPENRFLRQVIENVNQKVMTDWDTVKALEKLMNDNGWGTVQLSKKLGRRLAWVEDCLLLLNAGRKVQNKVMSGSISSNNYAEAYRRTKGMHQDRLMEKLVDKSLPGSTAMRAMTNALRDYPGKTEKLLSLDMSGYTAGEAAIKIQAIAPSRVDLLRAGIKHEMDEGSHVLLAIKTLKTVLGETPPEEISETNKKLVFMGLMETMEVVKKYLTTGGHEKQKRIE